MHIAQGLFKAVNVWHSGHLILEVGVVGPKSSKVNKCTEAGGIFKFYVADWFALMNDKMGGDMKKNQGQGTGGGTGGNTKEHGEK